MRIDDEFSHANLPCNGWNDIRLSTPILMIITMGLSILFGSQFDWPRSLAFGTAATISISDPNS